MLLILQQVLVACLPCACVRPCVRGDVWRRQRAAAAHRGPTSPGALHRYQWSYCKVTGPHVQPMAAQVTGSQLVRQGACDQCSSCCCSCLSSSVRVRSSVWFEAAFHQALPPCFEMHKLLLWLKDAVDTSLRRLWSVLPQMAYPDCRA